MKRKGLELSGLAFGQKFCIWISTLGGIGYLPAPGTFGSAAALLLLLLPLENLHLVMLCGSVVFTALGIYTIGKTEEHFGNDPSVVIIDEAAGICLTLASPLIPLEPLWVVLGFAFFRVFDIVKPWPINIIDRARGPLAVMGDDLLAGLLAGLALHAVFHITSILALFIAV